MSKTILPVDGKKNILITAALPYVHDIPHLGNLIGSVLSADVYARYARKQGYNVLYISGVDEYGSTTETKSQEEKVSPRDVCEKYYEFHKSIYSWFNISFDYFGRTSCQYPKSDKDWSHTLITHDIFKKLYENGYLKEEQVDQLYCLDCNRSLSDRYIMGTCPYCLYTNATGDQCHQCGQLLNPNELKEPSCRFDMHHKLISNITNHIYLDLSKLTPEYMEWFNMMSNDKKSWTINVKDVVYNYLRNRLMPRCITRNLSWGTPIPEIESIGSKYVDKVLYVWWDAPIGYISITANYTKEWKKWWMGENIELVQFIGKDNIPFHTIIFPATLIGTHEKYILPTHINATEYLTYIGKRFSKRNNTGIFCDDVMDTNIPSDIWRYYLLRIRPENADSSFTWSDFWIKINTELVNNIGNLINRVLTFCYKSYGSNKIKCNILTDYDKDYINVNNMNLQTYNKKMEKKEMKSALDIILQMCHNGNKYVNDSEPWNMIKTDPIKCESVLNVMLNSIILIASLLEPFIPNSMLKLASFYGLNELPTFEIFNENNLMEYELNEPHILFEKITDDQLEELTDNFN
jgi:methionyl-tRNA synthetase